MNNYFHVEYDDQNIAWLYFDTKDSSTNVLSQDALEAFDQQLISVAQAHPQGMVILSAKANGFIAGADVNSFAAIGSPAVAEKLISRAHDIFNRLEALSFPTVAMIHGYCLGGGLELALACDYRVGSTHPGTRLGFPEVRLGIFPGFGGSVRSIRLMGHLPAMQMMLSGRSVSAKVAQHLHLLNYAVPRRQLKNAARKLIADHPPLLRASLMQGLPGKRLLRPLTAHILRKKVSVQASPKHYPAPFALIEHWRKYAGNPGQMFHNEIHQVSRLLTADCAQNLIRVFQLQEMLKKQAQEQHFKVQHVHVVGGGVMGGDIAAWCVLKGLRVTLQDRAAEYLTGAVQRAHDLFKKKLKDPYLLQNAMDRLIPDPPGNGIGKADVVIEAIYEDIEAKQALYTDIEPAMKANALLATNTSSIPLEKLAEKLQAPERLLGLHFFNPVARMPLVEIVIQKDNSSEIIANAICFSKTIGKLPLRVKSHPGFLVNRVLMPYLLEAVTLLEENITAANIDAAAKDFGMPMGPIELADTVGLDICLSVAEKLSDTLHNKVPEILRKKVKEKHLGKKAGRGFYSWVKGKAQKDKPDATSDEQQHYADRMLMRLLNEAMACLSDGIVETADEIDAGVIFGTGFAPFLGGPMHYANNVGKEQILSKLRKLEYTYGKHFAPDPGWENP